MHISDMLGQYNRNISSGTEELKAASGMQKVVSTLEELSLEVFLTEPSVL